ncbi:hypothetical protein HHI36_004490, partial [Cryptolaemus montrouzieri]
MILVQRRGITSCKKRAGLKFTDLQFWKVQYDFMNVLDRLRHLGTTAMGNIVNALMLNAITIENRVEKRRFFGEEAVEGFVGSLRAID